MSMQARLAKLEAHQAGQDTAARVVDAAMLAALAGVGIQVAPDLLGATQAEMLATLSDGDLRRLERLVAGGGL